MSLAYFTNIESIYKEVTPVLHAHWEVIDVDNFYFNDESIYDEEDDHLSPEERESYSYCTEQYTGCNELNSSSIIISVKESVNPEKVNAVLILSDFDYTHDIAPRYINTGQFSPTFIETWVYGSQGKRESQWFAFLPERIGEKLVFSGIITTEELRDVLNTPVPTLGAALDYPHMRYKISRKIKKFGIYDPLSFTYLPQGEFAEALDYLTTCVAVKDRHIAIALRERMSRSWDSVYGFHTQITNDIDNFYCPSNPLINIPLWIKASHELPLFDESVSKSDIIDLLNKVLISDSRNKSFDHIYRDIMDWMKNLMTTTYFTIKV